MRPERNPLDLNNLPDEYTRDGKHVLEDSPSSGCRKKKSGVKDGKDECGKVYECRFCSLKFCKSQALGGHMNRHRQERETETLNHARQLVFRNDHNPTTHAAPHLGCCQPIAQAQASYHAASNTGDPTMPQRFPSYVSGSSSNYTPLPPPPPPPPIPHVEQPSEPFLYASPSRPLSFPSHYSQHHVRDYYVGHVLSSSHHNLNYLAASDSGYTCIGAPVGKAFVAGGKDRSLQKQGEGLIGGRNYSGTQQRLDPPSAINRLQNGL